MRGRLRHYHRQYQMIGYRDRSMLLSIGSFAISASIGAGKLILGVMVFSPWFIITAVYYLLLCGARGQLLWRFKQTRLIEEPLERYRRQFAVFRHSGVFVCLIGVSYLFVCLRMYFWGEGISYPYYLTYGVAAVAFYKIGTAIYGMVVSKRMKNPLLTTMKVIAFVDACVSIVAVQCALLMMSESASAATQSSALFGAGCSIVFVGIGVYMLLRKKVYPGPNEFDVKDKAKLQPAKRENALGAGTVSKKRLCSQLEEEQRYRVVRLISEQLWQKLSEADPNSRFVCSVTYENGEIQITGFTDTTFDYETCVRGILRDFDIRLAEFPVFCSVQHT